jgi:hypothetical protein
VSVVSSYPTDAGKNSSVAHPIGAISGVGGLTVQMSVHTSRWTVTLNWDAFAFCQ